MDPVICEPTWEMTRLAPTATSENWHCVTSDAVQYFRASMPTGDLSAALNSYAMSAMAPCRSTVRDFATAAPNTGVLSAWSSLGSAASAFW
ncbi:hypothetical protein PG993_003631 [Apiospora rasikravindrae]|uniref:DUF7735 domain-containing protein n=1 Tax=Apiospora rasikravindrae TaxID=990691 RepID=A0ABR1U021_9PEZI